MRYYLLLLLFVVQAAFGAAYSPLVNHPINVKDRGAKGDGVTDDTAVITAAIAALSASGGIVEIPNGTYIISSPITITTTKELTLRGEASVNATTPMSGTILKLKAASDCNMIVKNIGSRLNLANLCLDGNRTNQTATNLYGIWLKGTNSTIDRCTLSDIVIQNVSGVALQNDNRETKIFRLNVQNSLGDGIVNTASSDVIMEDILSGYNGGAGMKWIGASYSRIMRSDFYRNYWGMILTNCSANFFAGVQADANMADGLLLSSGGSQLTRNNVFMGSHFLVNNFPLDNTVAGGGSTVANGTYSNVRLLGDNTITPTFFGCSFYGYETTLTNRPKYLIEDARNYYLTNATEFNSVALVGCFFTASTNSVLGPYQAGLIRNAYIDSWIDGSRVYTDNAYWRETRTVRARITDQIATYGGLSANALWGTNISLPVANWHYLEDGVAWNLRSRPDNGLLAIQYAASGLSNAAITWTSGLTLNATNGAVAIGKGDAAASTAVQFEVIGNSKVGLDETISGVSGNAYYDGTWKHRANGPAYAFIPSYGTNVAAILIAASNSANAVVTWNESILFDDGGNVRIPQVLTPDSITLDGVNRTTWPTSAGVNVITNNGPSVVGYIPTYTDLTGTQVTPTNNVTLDTISTTTINATTWNAGSVIVTNAITAATGNIATANLGTVVVTNSITTPQIDAAVVNAGTFTVTNSISTPGVYANFVVSTNPIVPPVYTVATLPGASTNDGAIVWVSDAITPDAAAGGSFKSDGTNWVWAGSSPIVATADMRTFLLSCLRCQWVGTTPYMWAGSGDLLSGSTAFGDFTCSANSGSISSWTTYHTDGVQLSTSTSATSYPGLYLGQNLPSTNDWLITGTRANLAALCSETEQFWTQIGATASLSAFGTSHAAFIYDMYGTNTHNQTGAQTNNWVILDQITGVLTNTYDTGVLVDTEFHKFVRVVNDTNSWYYLDANFITNSTASPIVATYPLLVKINKTVGTTARQLRIDWAYQAIRYETPRSFAP